MDSKQMKNLLYKNRNNSKAPQYKRSFPRANGQDFRYRPLSGEIINPNNPELFAEVVLHSNIPHPDFPNNKYGSNFRCLGKGCPLCRDYFETREMEFKAGIKNGDSWKKRGRKYAIYWELDRTNKDEITLVHVDNTPYIVKNKKTKQNEKVGYTLQELKFFAIEAALNKNLTPFDYRKGNDIIMRSKKVDNKVKWNIFVDENVNAVPQDVLNKLKDLPQLSQIYKQYTWEELECVVRGISLREAKNVKRIVKGQDIKEKNNKDKEQSFDENVELKTKETKPEPKKEKQQEKLEDKEEVKTKEVNPILEEEEKSLEQSLMETSLDDEKQDESEDDSDYSKGLSDSLDSLFTTKIGEDND